MSIPLQMGSVKNYQRLLTIIGSEWINCINPSILTYCIARKNLVKGSSQQSLHITALSSMANRPKKNFMQSLQSEEAEFKCLAITVEAGCT
jgi:hypothetical protein